MLRISLASLSVALVLASTARAQIRGSGGGCASGLMGTGAASSLARTATGGTNAPGFGMSPAAAYSGIGGGTSASIMGAGSSINGSIAAAGSGMGSYGVTDWSNPSAQVMNADGASFAGLGAMNSMNDGPFPFAWDESYLLSDPFAVALASAERGSIDTTPRTRAKSTKSQFKVKRRVTRAKRTSR